MKHWSEMECVRNVSIAEALHACRHARPNFWLWTVANYLLRHNHVRPMRPRRATKPPTGWEMAHWSDQIGPRGFRLREVLWMLNTAPKSHTMARWLAE